MKEGLYEGKKGRRYYMKEGRKDPMKERKERRTI